MESDFFPTIVHLLLFFVLPPFFLGVINKTKALVAGRRGPPLLQAYFDLIKGLQRGRVIGRSSSLVSRLAPVGILVSILAAGLFLPLVGPPPIHFAGDIVLFASLFALIRFLIVLVALDAGSSFEGMGASREATFGALSELAFFAGLIVLVIMTHSTSLYGIFQVESVHSTLKPALFLIFLSFVFNLLTENSRMPVDDPNTHLELTMIHEVMILDTSGPELAVLLYASALKLFLTMILAVSVLWPTATWGMAVIPVLLLKALLMSVLVGLVESATARIRLRKVPGFLLVNFVVAMLALLVTVFGGTR